MRSYEFFLLSFLAILSTFTETKATPMNNPLLNNPWFNNTDCSLMEIKKLKSISDHKVINLVKIEDTNAIKNFMRRIAEIPADGSEMSKFGPGAEEINLEFHCGNKIQKISIFEKRFQTPSTGFNVEKSKLEEGLYNDIEALLFPDFNKRILKIENLPLSFKDFTMTYKGSTLKDFSPATIHTLTQKFSFRYKNHEQIVEIKSGQVPPQAKIVELQPSKVTSDSSITLQTYQSKQGGRLFPDYFQITK